ncbi:hypothetical protein PTKIN_Ptkin13bG0142400 [Pterospermum kingtungense]
MNGQAATQCPPEFWLFPSYFPVHPDPNGIYFKKHLSRVVDYIWAGEDGIKMQTYTYERAQLPQELTGFLMSDSVADGSCDCFLHILPGIDGLILLEILRLEKIFQCCVYFAMIPPKMVGEKMETEQFYDSINVILSYQSENGGIQLENQHEVDFGGR